MMSATRAFWRASALYMQTGRIPILSRFSSNSTGEKKDHAGVGLPPAPRPAASVGSAKAPPPPPTKVPPPPPPPIVVFDNSKYQVTQYFEYNPMSFYDFEVKLSPTRLPQQSSLKK